MLNCTDFLGSKRARSTAGVGGLISFVLLAVAPPGMAEDLDPEPLTPSPGTAVVSIAGEGAQLRAQFAGLAVSMMGFEHAPRNRSERETFRLTRENLETGDALIRFSTRAGCRLTSAEVDMGAEGKAKGERELSASYRFECDQPGQLDSAAVGLFVAFPALQRVFVRYELLDVRGAAELNRGRPVVSFVPLF